MIAGERNVQMKSVIKITDTLKWKYARCPRHNHTLLPIHWSGAHQPKTFNINIVLWIHLCFPWQKVTASEITEVRPYFLFHYS